MELNENTLEQILIRQRKEFESHLDEKLEATLARQDEKLEAALTRQDEKLEKLDAKIDGVEARLQSAIVRQGDQFERYMGVLVEELKGQIQLVAEGVSGVYEEVQRINAIEDKQKADILKLELGQLVQDDRLRRKVDREDFASREERVVKLEAKA